MKSVLALGLMLTALGLMGCSGIGLGAGGSGITNLRPAPPPNFSGEEFWGELSGRVDFAPGFLANEFLFLSPTSKGSGQVAGLVKDRNFYQSLQVRIDGKRGKLSTRVSEDGSFNFGKVRNGTYELHLVSGDRTLVRSPYTLDGKSNLSLTITVEGQDLADCDGDGDRSELVVSTTIQLISSRLRYTRHVPAVGDVKTTLPDGTVELLGQDDYVKSFRSDGRVEYRYDPKNELVDLDLEPELEFKRKKPHLGKRRTRGPSKEDIRAGRWFHVLTGKDRAPFILDVRFEAVGGEGPNREIGLFDLARFTIKTDDNGGSKVTAVRIEAWTKGSKHRSLRPVDDGSRQDLSPSWAGDQTSLDEERGDGVFTIAVPLDQTNYDFLTASHMLIRAENEDGLTSRPYSLHTYLPRRDPSQNGSDKQTPPLGRRIRNARLRKVPQGGPSTCTAQVELAGPPPHDLTGFLLGPSGYKKLMFPETLGGNRSILASIPQSLPGPGIYAILLSHPTEGMYYASFRHPVP